jgi:hypothetical protein
MDWVDLTGCCEHGDQPLTSMKCWEAPQLAASQEGPSSKDLVIRLKNKGKLCLTN